MERTFGLFYQLLRQLPGICDGEEARHSLVRQFTNGRTESLRETTVAEYRALCSHLQAMVRPSEKMSSALLRRERSTTLHLMQLFGVRTEQWDAVDRFCLDKRIAGKPFRRISMEEHGSLQRKLRAMIAKKEKEGGQP